MIRSKATSAHVYAAIEVDFEAVEQVRRAEREAFKAAEGFSLTYLPFISRAVVDAIREYPQVNASFGENELVVHNYVNLGIAVDLDFKGLMAPVIHDADGKRLRALAREINDLARRARSKKLGPDDIAGGTFTITNPGPFGTTMTSPIINQPQIAILSTDGIKRRPVVVDLPDGSEGIAIHSVGNITLTWDHRAFDGAYAAGSLRRIKEILETRAGPPSWPEAARCLASPGGGPSHRSEAAHVLSPAGDSSTPRPDASEIRVDEMQRPCPAGQVPRGDPSLVPARRRGRRAHRVWHSPAPP